MIKKKCNECGTLYPLNHAGACKVDGENDWSTACEKHPTLNLAGASSCQMCESERGIGEYKRKEKQWEKERSKLEEGDGATDPQEEATDPSAPAQQSDDSCCGCTVIIIVLVIIVYFFKSCSWFSDEPEEDGEDTSLLIDKDHFCDTNLYLGNRQLFRDLGATRDSGNAQKEV